MSYPSSSKAVLVIRHTGQIIPLAEAPVTIGRQADNIIVLADSQASRHHATIFSQAGTFIVQDMGSRNGTYVNEQRITTAHILRHGDQLRVGNTILDVQLAAAVDSTAQMPVTPGAYPPAPMESRSPALPIVAGVIVTGAVIVGVALVVLLLLPALRGGAPVVAIHSPTAGAQVSTGSEIILQATASGASDIARLELAVDGVLVAIVTSPEPKGQASLTANQPWTFGRAGPYTVSAVAYTSKERASAPASVSFTVVETMAQTTPTATPTTPSAAEPTDPATLPDLAISHVRIELETGGSCNYASTQLGARVGIANNGHADAGPFVVEVNGVQQTVSAGLAAGQMASLWFAGYASGENSVSVDVILQVEESDETNNTLSQMLPIPTLPPTCTPPPADAPPASDTPTATSTPTATPTPTPSSTPTATSTNTPTPTATPTHTPTPTQNPPQYDLYVRRMDFSPNLLVGETIELYVMIATDIYPSGGPAFPASHFRWRQGPGFPWQEEVCPESAPYASCQKTVYLSYSAPGDYTVEVEADNRGQVRETDEGNNTRGWTITVSPGSVTVSFDAFPDGSPIPSDRILNGGEFLARGIRLEGAPAGASSCGSIDTVPAIRIGQYGVPGHFLTTADPGDVARCNFGPVTILFTNPVSQVTLTFTGASATYTMEAFDGGGGFLGAAYRDAVAYGSPVEVGLASRAGNIARVTLSGPAGAVTAITQIRYEW